MSIRETLAAALAAALIAAGCGSDEVVLDDNVSPLREVSASGCSLMQRRCDLYLVTEPATVQIGTKIRIIDVAGGEARVQQDGEHEYEVESLYSHGSGWGPMKEVHVYLVGENQPLDALLLPEHVGTVEIGEIELSDGRLREAMIGAKLAFYQYEGW